MITAFSLMLTGPGLAQAQENERGSTALLEEVVVTARKREELSQTVPIAITAYNSEQLDALKVRDLGNLSVKMPNVALDDIGTFPTIANFSIRGLGINSSIPSIDPTVGVFVDGVYMGQNAGVVIDMSDIQSIEVLRGPQGTLFGRNVTGGAILINTRRPGDEAEFDARVAVDGNPNGDGGLTTYVMAGVGGPLSDTVGVRASFYHTDDDGYFENLLTGEDHGAAKTTIFRPVLSWEPHDDVRVYLRWEHLTSNGDGPASQNHANGLGIPGAFASFDRDSFDFSIDEPGFYELENDLVTLEVNWDVPFGDGTVTNIFGWKDYTSEGESDIDAQPVWLFHAPFWNNQEQFSNELRYTGTFGNARVTTGIYWFDNEVNYHERRNLLGIATGGVAPALVQDGGGNYNVESKAWFGAVDFDLNEAWTLTAGARYTKEDKDAEIASLIFNVNTSCNVVTNPSGCLFDFNDEASWNAWSGKLGVTWNIRNDLRMYGHWSRSQRSGGYNLRNTAVDTVNLGPGPFDEETVDSFEIGLKTELGGRGRLNAAVFYNEVDDMQREVNLADPVAGVVQIIKNTANAEIWGFEAEGAFSLGNRTVLTVSVGYINPEYSDVFFDLNGDGVVNESDEDLKLPRAAEWTWSLGINHDFRVGDWGYLTARANYAYRDDAFFTDSNLGYFLSQNILDAGLDFRADGGHWIYSVYGRNLLDEVNHGGDTQLPTMLGPLPTGGTFSPLMKGRVVGIEVAYSY
ncbi:TonB-dependent receptor [Elongatibacter sediminis]|uniref:TonB-dependent receptor n=1 Tax=Elongatibacter sediminis TaxID=3119006 RepID=A0AAW9RJR7_9GAMM